MLDPALFPERVPVMVPYLTMGLGLVAGVFLTTLIFLLTLRPEEGGRVLPGKWIRREGSTRGGRGTAVPGRCSRSSPTRDERAEPGVESGRLPRVEPSLSIVQPRGDETWINSPTQNWRMGR